MNNKITFMLIFLLLIFFSTIFANEFKARLFGTPEYTIGINEHMAKSREPILEQESYAYIVHMDATVVDLHCDTILRFLRGQDLSIDNPQGHVDIPKLRKGGVDLQIFACNVGPPRNEIEKNTRATTIFKQIDAVNRLIEENKDDLTVVKSYEDMERIASQKSSDGAGKIGILMGIESGYAIENDLALLRTFYNAGIRLMTLTHNTRTDWADASSDVGAKFGGLTEFGEIVVNEMNRIGMIIDVSHAHDETFWDVIRISKDPIVASHSACRALSDIHRNLTDDMLIALAKNGGVIGLTFVPDFLNLEPYKRIEYLATDLAVKYDLPANWRETIDADSKEGMIIFSEYREKLKKLEKNLPKIDVKTFVDHIDHAVKVTGSVDHVALGSDFDGIGQTPVGLEDVSKIPAITEELFKRGYREKDVRKILGGNFLRVLRKVCSERN